MLFRIGTSTFLLAALALSTTALTGQDAKTQDSKTPATQDARQNTHDGKVVSITDTELVMTNSQGWEHSHPLTNKSHITLDGKVCKATDLKPATKIRVNAREDKQNSPVWIEGIDNNSSFANYRQDGEFVSITGDQLVTHCTETEQTFTRTLAPRIKVTCDAEICPASSLEKGQMVRVTSDQDNPYLAIRIESLDENSNFVDTQFDGKIIRVNDDELVFSEMKNKKEWTSTFSRDVKVTCDGQPCKISDLKPDMMIRLTSEVEAPQVAIHIEALKKHLEFVTNRQNGEIVSVTDNQLVMTETQGKNEHTSTFANDVTVTLDGKICRRSDLKKGMRIRITSDRDNPHAATMIEALEKNTEFRNL